MAGFAQLGSAFASGEIDIQAEATERLRQQRARDAQELESAKGTGAGAGSIIGGILGGIVGGPAGIVGGLSAGGAIGSGLGGLAEGGGGEELLPIVEGITGLADQKQPSGVSGVIQKKAAGLKRKELGGKLGLTPDQTENLQRDPTTLALLGRAFA